MAKKKNNKVRMTLYRLVNLPSLEVAIREKYRDDSNENYSHKTISISGRAAELYWGSVERDRAGWTSTVHSLTTESLNVRQAIPSSVIVIRDDEEQIGTSSISRDNSVEAMEGDGGKPIPAWAITFGMGFQMIDPYYIEPRFGLQVAIRSATGEGLNVLSKTTLDESPQMVRSTIPLGATLRRFGFEEFGDLATNLVVKGSLETEDTEKSVKIQGGDSLKLPLPTNPEELLVILNNIKDILTRGPATPELAALEHLTVVKDADINANLDKLLVKEIGNKSDQISLSYPYEIIDEFGRVSAFKIVGMRERGKKDFLPTVDDLLKPMRSSRENKVSEEECMNKLKNLSVRLFQSAEDKDPSGPTIPIKKWLTFQKTLDDGKRYFLQNGIWYSMDGNYINSIQKCVKDIFERKTEVLDNIQDWEIYEAPKDKSEENKRKAEDIYNQEIAKQLGGLCLDRKLIRPESGGSGIEACDVLLPDGIFIHVKHVSSSAPASHLLAQSLVSTSLLRNDEYSQDKLRKMIGDMGEDTNKYDVRPRQVVIVMAKDDKLLTAESLFTFTKINLVRHDQNLANLDVKLNIVPVIRRK